MYGGDDGARTRDLCRDSHFQRPEEPLATLIGPLMDPRPLPCKPLPERRTREIVQVVRG